MRRFKIFSAMLALLVLSISVLTTPIPYVKSNHVLAAAGLGCGRPVGEPCPPNPSSSNPSSSSGNPASPNAQGSVGSDSVNSGAACSGLDQLGGTSCGSSTGQTAVGNVASRVVTIISYLAGIIAIIMIIISGIRYTTSGGDSTKVGAAKTALVYALIGVAVAALAQVLVHYVLGQTGNV